mgnify:CR=1 FL=1
MQDGLIDEAAMADAQRAAKEARQNLVSYLVTKNIVEAREIAIAASQMFGVPLLDLDAVQVDLDTVKNMKGHFVEAIVAPDYKEDALARLRTRKNIRLVRTNLPFRPSPEYEMVKVSGGMLLQTSQYPEIHPESFKTVTKRAASAEDVRDIVFGMQVSKYVKSNSIVLVKDRVTVGMGAGQMSRVDSVVLACLKAGARGRGSVLVSDAFFPFRDGIDEAAKGGVAVIAQPGGSIRDQDAIDACDEHGIAMLFTGMRLFRH